MTGLSGNGKTTMIEQICAKHNREFYRVNITCQTDEDDLLGGFRLINGETVWCDCPVVAAMKNGGVLLLDEIDRVSRDHVSPAGAEARVSSPRRSSVGSACCWFPNLRHCQHQG